MNAVTPATPGEVTKLHALGLAIVVNVRSPSEFATGHIPGARNFPIDQLTPDAISFAGATEVITVCARGGARSHGAAERLRSLGLPARPLCGGLAAWPSHQVTDLKQETP